MDLRTDITGKTPEERCSERRSRVEKELGLDLPYLKPVDGSIGHADEKNCEQMFGTVPLPVGYAGPLKVTFSSGEIHEIHLPLATTEGALVASVNRGCKALTVSGGVKISSIHHGMSRSLAFRVHDVKDVRKEIGSSAKEWMPVAHSTSQHLKVLKYELDESDDYLFLTIYCDTDEAMGMNMVTIAAQAVGEWLEKNIDGLEFVTVAGNVDSDKKPSARVHERGRGYEVTAEAILTEDVIRDVLKSTPEALLAVAEAKLKHGSKIAGAIGSNLHAANIIAALYLATGQDAAHVVEGSLTDTFVTSAQTPTSELTVSVRCPALLVGLRGGGTTLPAQSQCLKMLIAPKTSLHPKTQLAESIGAAVLAGEISLLAAQASHTLASAHGTFGR
ncbi:MAG: 3-hydroxy-3-methylglutaryl-CoA reductase [Candidatus Peribacteraceae bacterium]|nr:3-hydroxy-3-methylglutaryl-CoA reductase [Candidatus Peribacteraceae bacterium]